MAVALDTVLAEITTRLQAGVLPWRKPWNGGADPGRPLRADGQPFSGSNLIMLAMLGAAAAYRSPYWLTFQQALAHGGCVRRGEKGSPALLYKTRVTGEPETPTGDDEPLRILRFAKPYAVFNAEQIEGLPPAFAAAPPIDPELRRAVEDATLAAVPATVEIGGAHAFFDRRRDVVRLPPPEVFRSADDFRATRWHELAHWTGGAARLDRTFGQRFGDEAYAFEELVAELASVILGMTLGAPLALLDDHASYIAGWVKVLAARPQALLEAARHAQKVVDHLLSYSRSSATAAEEFRAAA